MFHVYKNPSQNSLRHVIFENPDMENIKEGSDQREKRDTELGDDYMHMVLFTAGTALLMACLKRALMVFLLEQWRAWVFLLLNLVLLAILFTSSFCNSKLGQERDNAEVMVVKKIERKKKKKQCRCWSEQLVESCKDCQKKCWRSSSVSDGNERSTCIEEDMEFNHPKAYKEEDMEDSKTYEEEDVEAPKLSKEELNERAEAFIVMFRQHLVSDARKGGKPFL